MESSGKKRKLMMISHDNHHHHHQEEDEDDNEEVKIDKFFALIRDIREARDRLMNASDGTLMEQENMDRNNKKKKRRIDGEENKVTVWKPAFQPEDFMEESRAKNPTTMVETSRIKEVVAEKEETKDGLDLRLSL